MSKMRRVLVTGAGTRLGQIISVRLAKEGFHVIVHYHSSSTGAKQTLEQVVLAGGSGETVQADLSDHGQASKLLEELAACSGPVQALVNNASLFEPDDLNDLSEGQWDRHFAVNLKAPVFLTQGFAAQLPKDEVGHVVNLLDQRLFRLNPTFFSYTLSKAALATATITMAQSLAPNIRVNAVAPGPTLPNVRQSMDDFKRQCQASLLQNGSPPAEIVDAVLFLLNSQVITGQVLTVDGGQHLGWRAEDLAGGIE